MGCGGKAKRDIAFSPKQAPKAPPLRSAGAVHDNFRPGVVTFFKNSTLRPLQPLIISVRDQTIERISVPGQIHTADSVIYSPV